METFFYLLTRTFFPAVRVLEKEKLIWGQKFHPRLMDSVVPVAEYTSQYLQMHEMPEACFCVSGTFAMSLGGRCYRMEPGDLCLIGRNISHYESCLEENTDYTVIWIHFLHSKDLHFNLFRYKGGNYRPSHSLDVCVPPDVIRYFDKILGTSLAWAVLKREVQALFRVIEHQLKFRGPTMSVSAGSDPAQSHYSIQRIEKAKQYIEENFGERVTIKEVARFVGLNPAYFGRLFFQMEAVTFKQFLSMTRLREAHRLLNETTLTIAEIAFRSGFEDPYYFTRTFKKYSGISPREFRNRY